MTARPSLVCTLLKCGLLASIVMMTATTKAATVRVNPATWTLRWYLNHSAGTCREGSYKATRVMGALEVEKWRYMCVCVCTLMCVTETYGSMHGAAPAPQRDASTDLKATYTLPSRLVGYPLIRGYVAYSLQ